MLTWYLLNVKPFCRIQYWWWKSSGAIPIHPIRHHSWRCQNLWLLLPYYYFSVLCPQLTQCHQSSVNPIQQRKVGEGQLGGSEGAAARQSSYKVLHFPPWWKWPLQWALLMYITVIKFTCLLRPITSHNFNGWPDMLQNNSMLLSDIFVKITRVLPVAHNAIITPGSKLLYRIHFFSLTYTHYMTQSSWFNKTGWSANARDGAVEIHPHRVFSTYLCSVERERIRT